MPSSTVAEYSLTGLSIINAALRKVGVTGIYETSNSNMQTVCVEALNLLLMSWQSLGYFDLNNTVIAVPCSSCNTSGNFTIGPTGATITGSGVLDIVSAVRRTNNVDTPIDIISDLEYNLMPNKFTEGTPISIAFQNTGSISQFSVYMTPDTYHRANTTLILSVVSKPEIINNMATENLSIPNAFQKAVVYALAVDIAPEFGLDLTNRQILKAEAKEHLDAALSIAYQSESVYIRPRK